jgi:hypothetical protein
MLLALSVGARSDNARAEAPEQAAESAPVATPGITVPAVAAAPAKLIAPPDDACVPAAVQPAPAKRREPDAPVEWRPPSPNGEPPGDLPRPAAAEPVVIAPMIEMKCASGKVLVHVTAPTQVSHYTGEKIPVTVEVLLAPGAVIDLRSIDVNENASGYELVGEPQSRVEQVDGATKVTVEVTVQSFETGRQFLPVSFTLRYATIISEEGTPIWQDLVTGDLRLIHHDTVPSGAKAELLMVSHEMAQARISWAYVPSLVVGCTLVGVALMLAAVRRINRLRPPQSLSPHQSTWLALDELVVSGNKIGFTQAHYEKISAALKSFLKIRYGLASFDQKYVEAMMSGDPAATAVNEALSILHSVVYNGEKLTSARHGQLLDCLCTIVPKPFSL